MRKFVIGYCEDDTQHFIMSVCPGGLKCSLKPERGLLFDHLDQAESMLSLLISMDYFIDYDDCDLFVKSVFIDDCEE